MTPTYPFLPVPEHLPRIELDYFQDMFGDAGGRAYSGDFDVIGRVLRAIGLRAWLRMGAGGERCTCI